MASGKPSPTEDLLWKLRAFELPVTLKVGFLEAEIGTLTPDGYWEGDDVMVALASLLEETVRFIRRDMHDRGAP